MSAAVEPIRGADNPLSPEELLESFTVTRQMSLAIAEPLSEEDCQIQSMPDASPTKWHLAHTSWFFETFILKKFVQGCGVFDQAFETLFNSYYNKIGEQFSRPDRGVLSRPSLVEILRYRAYVDQELSKFVQSDDCTVAALELLEIGIQHEKQHQELILTDILHGFYQNPMLPAYTEAIKEQMKPAVDLKWMEFEEGLREIGASTGGYSFDNERPRHRQYLQGFRIANRCVTNEEYLQFIEDGGYKCSEFWLADGWHWVLENSREAPIYWRDLDEGWYQFSLQGLQPLKPNLPVCHLNYFEASAFAVWAGKRLPTEFEWEVAADALAEKSSTPNFLDPDSLQLKVDCEDQMLGNLWQWTSSSYSAYPGFKPFTGDAGEYNGKFMSGQFVLRGGSFVSPKNHIRTSYRNFFYPHQNWQFSGIRLAEDLDE